MVRGTEWLADSPDDLAAVLVHCIQGANRIRSRAAVPSTESIPRREVTNQCMHGGVLFQLKCTAM